MSAGSIADSGTILHPELRVVITGVGVVSPIGIGNQNFWHNLTAGNSGIGFLRSLPREELPIKLAAEVDGFEPRDYLRDRKFLKVMSREIQFGAAAANLAVADAGIRSEVEPERLGVVFGSGRISTTPDELSEAVRACSQSVEGMFEMTRWGEDGMGRIAPLWLLPQLPNMPACHISIDHDARGPNNTITSRDASALLALAEAIRVIERDAADAMIVGASGSCIHPVDIAKLSLFETLSRREEDPQKAMRPFDMDRDGTIVGEGGACFVVERMSHALRRGAEIYAEVLGVGAGCDGKGDENRYAGTGLVQAMSAAIRQAGIRPEEIGHLNAHGKSTRRDDWVESRAVRSAFGESADKIKVTALKSYLGYSDAGCGAVEMAGSILAIRNGQLPGTLNYERPDPDCQLNIAHDGPTQLQNRVAMTVNRTNMGQSVAAILRAV